MCRRFAPAKKKMQQILLLLWTNKVWGRWIKTKNPPVWSFSHLCSSCNVARRINTQRSEGTNRGIFRGWLEIQVENRLGRRR
ncbi:hypothetical protein K438DRAFT_694908 [Mycena galopus ATCC 62051]|nr:hypothetical protein K438DRAFT_694908 [Mycena galopus ATCC 62051]